MDFIIKNSIKEEAEKKITSRKMSLRIIRMLEKSALAIALVGGIGFIVINILTPGAFEGEIGGEFGKNYFLIFMFGSIIIGTFLVVWILLLTLRIRVSQIGINDRVNESLRIEDNCLTYTYRLKYQSLPTDRGVVAVKLDEISTVKYDADLGKLTIHGRISDQWIEDFRGIDRVNISNAEEGRFTIYDYFSPSLIEELKRYSVPIE